MVYVNADGTVGGPRKRRSPFRFISDLITGLFDFIGLFFRTLTASPSALEAERVSFYLCSMLGFNCRGYPGINWMSVLLFDI